MLGPRREGGGIDSWGKRAPATISCKLVGDSEVAAAAAGSWRCGARSRSVDEPCAARLSVECAVAIAAVRDDPAVIPTARALSVVSTVPTTAALVASVAEVVVPWMIRLALVAASAPKRSLMTPSSLATLTLPLFPEAASNSSNSDASTCGVIAGAAGPDSAADAIGAAEEGTGLSVGSGSGLGPK